MNYMTEDFKLWDNIKSQLKTTCIFEINYDKDFTNFDFLQKKSENIYFTQNIKKFFNILCKIIFKIQRDFKKFTKYMDFDEDLMEKHSIYWKKMIRDLNVYTVYLLTHIEEEGEKNKKERKLINCFDYNYIKCYSDLFFNSSDIVSTFKKYIKDEQLKQIDENIKKISKKDIHLAFNHHVNLI